VDEYRFFDKPILLQPWLDRCGCEGEDATRVVEWLGDRVKGDTIVLDRIAVKAVPA
jgi:hypothetical protein